MTQTSAPMRTTSRRSMSAAFGPYFAPAFAHLVVLATGPGWAVTATKALLMPLLVLAGHRRPTSRAAGAAHLGTLRPRRALAAQGLIAAGVLRTLRTERW